MSVFVHNLRMQMYDFFFILTKTMKILFYFPIYILLIFMCDIIKKIHWGKCPEM